jgi:hypothetical protein
LRRTQKYDKITKLFLKFENFVKLQWSWYWQNHVINDQASAILQRNSKSKPNSKACSGVLNVGVHRKIMNHLNEKFVNLPGITAQIRLKRQQQNDWHFYGSIIFSTCRLVSVLPLVILCLLPPEIMSKQAKLYISSTIDTIDYRKVASSRLSECLTIAAVSVSSTFKECRLFEFFILHTWNI